WTGEIVNRRKKPNPNSTLMAFKGYLFIPTTLLGFLHSVLKSYNND
ncbi:Uncharacterized protein APZ42_006070, partial [Daphnia magna]